MESKSYPESERKGHKRKLADTFGRFAGVDEPNNGISVSIREQVEVLRTCVSWKENDRIAARRAAHGIAELAKNGEKKSNQSCFLKSRRSCAYDLLTVLCL